MCRDISNRGDLQILQVLNTKGFVNVKQDGAYSDILVRKPETWPKLVEMIMFNNSNWSSLYLKYTQEWV